MGGCPPLDHHRWSPPRGRERDAGSPESIVSDGRNIVQVAHVPTMAANGKEDPAQGRRTSRTGLRLGLAALVAVTVVLGLIFVPVSSSATQVHFSAGSSATTTLTIPRPTWVTIRFDRVGGYGGMMAGSGMVYWMDGPSGMMFDHSMMRSGDSYSFWTWGGTFHCGTGYVGSGNSVISVWVNATWGML